MKTFFNYINIFLLINFLSLTSEEICPKDQISITALGKCESIESFLLNESLSLKTENLLYLASNNDRKIEKDGYKLEIFKLNDPKLQSHNKRKSKIYIPNSCMERMSNHEKIKLDKDKGIIILVSDYNKLNRNNIPNNYFIIRHNSDNTEMKYINSQNFDFSFCNKDPILFEDEININNLLYIPNDNNTSNEKVDINTVLSVRKFGIDLFDPYSDFFNDICFKFTSEKGSDVTLESRVEDYYQNITFCNETENAHYLSYNYSENTKSITFRCAFGFYKDANDKSNYLDIIDTELKTFASVSNFKVITCYKEFLSLKAIIRNYGGMICIIVLFIQIICFLLFCFLGLKSIRKQLEDLFNLGNEIIRRQSLLNNANLNYEKEEENSSRTGLDNIKNTQKEKPPFESQAKNNAHPPKKKESSVSGENTDDVIKIEKDNSKSNEAKNIEKSIQQENKKEKKEEINKSNISNKEKKEEIVNDNLNKKLLVENKLSASIIRKEKVKEADKATNIDIKSENSQLYEYENDELNEQPFDKAIKNDKRGFCNYYCNILVISHIVLNVFFRHSDYNLFVVKLGLLFMTFPINLTFNILFFTNKAMKLNYIKSMEDISMFWNNIANSVYSSILSSIFLIILKLVCLTHNSVRALRKIKNVNLAKKKSVCVLRCIKIRLMLYYLLSFVFLAGFGFYVLCFCSVFENTQNVLIKSTFTSWVISLVYPFGICFITSIFRSLALKCKSKCLYAIKQLLQWL